MNKVKFKEYVQEFANGIRIRDHDDALRIFMRIKRYEKKCGNNVEIARENLKIFFEYPTETIRQDNRLLMVYQGLMVSKIYTNFKEKKPKNNGGQGVQKANN